MIKRPKVKNKTLDQWLDESYEMNKSVIDKVYARTVRVLTQEETTKEAFIRDMQQTAETYKFGTGFKAMRKSFDKFSREGDFMSSQERAFHNLASMKSNLGDNAMYQFQNLIRDNGKFASFEPAKMIWNKKEGVWIYDNSIIIDFRNSPYQIVLRRIR